MNVVTIRTLNEHERKSIQDALEYYIKGHDSVQAWSQKIVLKDMLNSLMWADEKK